MTSLLKLKLSNSVLGLCSLTDSVSQVVQLSSSNLSKSYYLNLLNNGRMERENSFNSAAVSNSAHGEGLAYTAVLLSNYGAFKDLDS